MTAGKLQTSQTLQVLRTDPSIHLSFRLRWHSQDHGRLSDVWCGVCGSDDEERAVSGQGRA